jgi:hypothetical protein
MFIASRYNLRIAVAPPDVERFALAAARVLRKRGAAKVYFLGDAGKDYAFLREHASEVSVVERENEPSNFLSSARVVFDGVELIVVSMQHTRRDEWKAIGSQIVEGASAESLSG